MTSTEKDTETTALQNKIDAILKRKVKNNFANIETFDSIENQGDIESKTTKPDVTEGFDTMYDTAAVLQDDIKLSYQTKASKWKNAFKFVTDLKPKDMGIEFKGVKPKATGWGKIFKAIFYMYPILVGLIVDDVVSAVPKTMERKMSHDTFDKKKKHDALIMVNTAYEFGYTMLSIYFSHMIYARLYGSNRLKNVDEFLRVGMPPVDFLLHRFVFLYLTLLPTLVYHFFYDVLRNVVWGMGLDGYPTLKFIFIFLVCYGITHLFLEKMGNMFLQIFDYKASGFMYIMIILAWVQHLLSLPYDAFKQKQAEAQGQLMGNMAGMTSGFPGITSEFDILINTRGLYIFVLLIHLAASLMMAPLCQLVGVVYIAYAFAGSPSNWIAVLSGLLFKTASSFMSEVQTDCSKSVFSNKEEILGGLDNIAYLYGYRFWIFFIMMLFFFFKTIQSAVEMKLLALRTAVTTINAYITATMAVIYSAHVYFEKHIYNEGVNPHADKPPAPKSSSSTKNHADVIIVDDAIPKKVVPILSNVISIPDSEQIVIPQQDDMSKIAAAFPTTVLDGIMRK